MSRAKGCATMVGLGGLALATGALVVFRSWVGAALIAVVTLFVSSLILMDDRRVARGNRRGSAQ